MVTIIDFKSGKPIEQFSAADAKKKVNCSSESAVSDNAIFLIEDQVELHPGTFLVAHDIFFCLEQEMWCDVILGAYVGKPGKGTYLCTVHPYIIGAELEKYKESLPVGRHILSTQPRQLYDVAQQPGLGVLESICSSDIGVGCRVKSSDYKEYFKLRREYGFE